ncbi:MAG: hypothetical protein ACXABK_06005 [Candidatus Heimdallarchaeaceae archaeon]|jgi:hypothetical protein
MTFVEETTIKQKFENSRMMKYIIYILISVTIISTIVYYVIVIFELEKAAEVLFILHLVIWFVFVAFSIAFTIVMRRAKDERVFFLYSSILGFVLLAVEVFIALFVALSVFGFGHLF